MLSSSAYSLKPGSGGIEEVVKLGLSDDEGSQLEESANGAKIVEVTHGQFGPQHTLAALGFEFWYEFGSTYSFLSAYRIEDLAHAADIAISWRPFLLGPIFNEQGWEDSPFNVYPAKGRYMWRDMERLCAKYGVPFAKPSRFPRDSLLAARVACLARVESEPWLPDFIRAVFRANFAEDREIGDPVQIRSILDELGRPGAEIVERARKPENKQRLHDHTHRAIELGIFGAPSFVVGGELFWGNDRLEDALAWHQAHTA